MRGIGLYEFGGSEALVKRTQKRFVEIFRHAAPVLDIGCGRGVFMELLRDAQIESVGIDHSPESVAACRQKGFTVFNEDAHQYLSRANAKFGGVFLSHVIEHLGYADGMNLFKLCFNALRPGGTLVVVTPNSADLAVISEIFWLDPTHVRPYPKLLLQSMLQANDFCIKRSGEFLGSWRMVGWRRVPGYIFRRLLLGRHYGKPNTFVIAEKKPQPPSPEIRKVS